MYSTVSQGFETGYTVHSSQEFTDQLPIMVSQGCDRLHTDRIYLHHEIEIAGYQQDTFDHWI